MDIDKKTRWADDGCGDVMDAANGETIALVMGSRHLKTHKTRLIAAAPEMLELLRDVRQYVADANLRSDRYAETDLKAIDALLAKIDGND